MLCSRNLCAAGNYTVGCGGDSAGSCRRCAACDAGFYNDGCLRDTPGTCATCPPATYALARGSRVCSACGTACGNGTFSVACGGVLQGSCQACVECPMGQFLAGCGGASGPGTCIQCPAGQYSSGERCVSCCPTMFNRKYETAAECLDMARVDVSGQGVGAVLSVPNVTTRAIVDGCVSGGVRFNASWTETVAGANGTTEDLRSLAFTCSCAPAACPLGQFLADGGTCVSCCPEDFGTQDSCESLTTPLKTSPLFVGSSDGKVSPENAKEDYSNPVAFTERVCSLVTTN
ncbi:hypothetical protein T484DRAFT_2085390 [Baffinella frigidus]|nr:hypothetical protein T484DRAFT_2085390 [Cryptophyta sp. CCMP2293]